MKPTSIWFTFFLLSLIGSCLGRPLYPLPSKTYEQKRQPFQTFRPYNIAHRGSNGEFPEETAPAYMRAIEEGADFIESDIIATKDGALICHHNVTLDETTDIADHKEFANRKTTYEVQGVNMTGWFTVDFTLDELKTLRAKQRFPFRDQQYNGKLPIITFEEFISIALDAPRVVGIYPEIKNPIFINKHVKWNDGKKFEDRIVEMLKKLINSPKVFLIDDFNVRTEDTNQTYNEITSDEYFNFIKNYVVGIGPWKDTVVIPKHNHLTPPTDLVARAHAHDLQVHPYTYRNENKFLHFDFHQDSYEEYNYWINTIGVDGLFTDFTGSLHNFQQWTESAKHGKDASSLLHKIASMISSNRKT